MSEFTTKECKRSIRVLERMREVVQKKLGVVEEARIRADVMEVRGFCGHRLENSGCDKSECEPSRIEECEYIIAGETLFWYSKLVCKELGDDKYFALFSKSKFESESRFQPLLERMMNGEW